jgi:hypothetical protein
MKRLVGDDSPYLDPVNPDLGLAFQATGGMMKPAQLGSSFRHVFFA